ncbi:MAG: hypothetical protein CL833_08975 [Crocinitomicaceae bacterium]|nr:hypothetical protein [Crocinitomicaceae bacterium]
MNKERAREILKKAGVFGKYEMTKKENDYVRKIWLEHPNGNMSIYSTLLMIAYGYKRALIHIDDEINWR